MDYPISRHILIPFIKKHISKTEGIENLPNHNPFIVVANHVSIADPLFIFATLFPRYKKKIHFLTKQGRYGDLFQKIIGQKWAGCIFVDPKNPQTCLEEAYKHICKKNLVGIFSEGVIISKGNQLSRGKTGAIRLALQTKTNILPVGIETVGEPRRLWKKHFNELPERLKMHIGKNLEVLLTADGIYNSSTDTYHKLSAEDWQTLSRLTYSTHLDAFRLFAYEKNPVTIRIGKPISLEKYYNSPITNELLRQLTDSLMKTIASLSNKSYFS